MAVDEKAIEETVSTLAIQRLLSAYADAVNRRAWSEFEHRAFDPLLATARDNRVFDFPAKFETLLGHGD